MRPVRIGEAIWLINCNKSNLVAAETGARPSLFLSKDSGQ